MHSYKAHRINVNIFKSATPTKHYIFMQDTKGIRYEFLMNLKRASLTLYLKQKKM